MTRIALTLCAALAACDQSPDERIAELDEEVTVDCGRRSGEYESVARAQEIVGCMNDARDADVHAKLLADFDIDIVVHIYTVDGAFVQVEGFTEHDGEDRFSEYRCATFAATEATISGMTIATVATSDCETVRDW